MTRLHFIMVLIVVWLLVAVLIACTSTTPTISMPSKCIDHQTAEWAWWDVPAADGSRSAIVSKAFECVGGKWVETGEHKDLDKLEKLGLIREQ